MALKCKKTSLWLILFSSVLSMCGCQSKSDQQSIIEIAQKTRQAFQNHDYASYIECMDHTYSGLPVITKDMFDAASNLINENPKSIDLFAPDLLTHTKFIKIKKDGDWAGYCALTDTNDPEFISVSVFLFHRAKGQWRWCGVQQSYAKGSPTSTWAQRGAAHWENEQDAVDWIDKNPEFDLNFLKRKYFKKS